jgi:hypothetical protein
MRVRTREMTEKILWGLKKNRFDALDEIVDCEASLGGWLLKPGEASLSRVLGNR